MSTEVQKRNCPNDETLLPTLGHFFPNFLECQAFEELPKLFLLTITFPDKFVYTHGSCWYVIIKFKHFLINKLCINIYLKCF